MVAAEAKDSATELTSSIVELLEIHWQELLKRKEERQYKESGLDHAAEHLVQLEAVLVNKPKFELTTHCLEVFSIKLPLKLLLPKILKLIEKLLVVQQKRKNIFHEYITNIYTMSFTRFAFDSHIDSRVDRAILAIAVIQCYKIPLTTARELVLKLRKEHSKEKALLVWMDKLLN